MTSQLFHGLQSWLIPYAAYFYDVLAAAGYRPRVTSVYRSSQKQAWLYDRWRRGESQLPAAPPGRSKHQFGLAFDLVTRPPELAQYAGQFWQAMGGKWGGPGDPVHFEV